MKRLLSFFIVLIAISVGIRTELMGQSQQRYLYEAKNAYENKEYFAAHSYISTYLENIDSANQPLDLIYLAAEAARQFNAFGLAEMNYQKVVDNERNGNFQLAQYWLALTQIRQGKYADALTNLNNFKAEQEGTNAYFDKMSELLIKSSNWALDQPQSNEAVEMIHLGTGINTEFSEVGATRIDDTLFFSSLRFPNDKDKHSPKRPLSKVLFSQDLASSQLYEALNKKEQENFHIGNLIYDAEANTIYYTKCSYTQGEEIRCDLFRRTYGSELGPEEGLEGINLDSFTTTQPSIGLLPNGGSKALYFSSDRPGGMGKSDIWYVEIKADQTLGTPRNLSKINTVGDDMTPFYHEPSRALYYSSDARVGFGGQDIFKAVFDKFGKAEEPLNLGKPFNSSYDDIYFTLNTEETEAFFSSNRLTSFFLDTAAEACCFDIYQNNINPRINLLALTFDKKTRDALAGATVFLYDNGELIGQVTNFDSNDFAFPLQRNRDYTLKAEKEGYRGDELSFDTRSNLFGETITKKLYLERAEVFLDLCVFDDLTKDPIIGSEVLIVERSTGDTAFYGILTEDNCEKIKVIPGKDYDIRVEKDGYQPSAFLFSVPSDANEDLKRDVFLKKWTLKDLLPLVVYFDNDIPDRRSYRSSTNKTYSETYENYVAKKDEFIQKNLEFYPIQDHSRVALDVSRFFDEDVTPSKERLEQLKIVLEELMTNGAEVEIEVQGFASPRATSGYNRKLSSRRVNSVLNDISNYKDGILNPYQDAKKLVLTSQSYGESKASPEARQTEYEEIPSIYSVSASKERKVVIDLVREENSSSTKK